MVRIRKDGSTIRQQAYARRVFGGQGVSKSAIALDVGYTKNVASSPRSKIETRRGFHNAIARLAADSHNLALKAMAEMEGRGFDDFTNKELIAALGTIAAAWKSFNEPLLKKNDDDDGGDKSKNRLRTVVLQRVEKQIIESPKPIDHDDHAKEIIDEVEQELVKEGVIEGEKEDPGF